MIRTVSIILIGTFFVSSALPAGARTFSKSTLSPELRLSQDQFRERYLAHVTVLAHRAVNEYISGMIPSQGIEKLRNRRDHIWIDDRIKQDILIVSIPDLLKNTGQFAHVGLGRKNGIPVIYVDGKYFYNEAVLSHDKDEISKWETKRRELGLDYKGMREWIRTSPEAKKLAKDIHYSSRSLAELYSEVRQNYADHLDWDNIYAAYLAYGLDEEDDDVNIAASSSREKRKARRAAERKKEKEKKKAKDAKEKKKTEKRYTRREIIKGAVKAAPLIAGIIIAVRYFTDDRHSPGSPERSGVEAPGLPLETDKTVYMIGQEHMDPYLQKVLGGYIWQNKSGLGGPVDSFENRDWREGLEKALNSDEPKRALGVYRKDVEKIRRLIRDKKNGIKVLASENSKEYAEGLRARALKGEFEELVGILRQRGVDDPVKKAHDLMLLTEGPVAYMVLTRDPVLDGITVTGLDDAALQARTMHTYQKLMQGIEYLKKVSVDKAAAEEFHRKFDEITQRTGGIVPEAEIRELLKPFKTRQELAAASLIIRYMHEIVVMGEKRSEIFADRIARQRGNVLTWTGRAHIGGTKRALGKRKGREFKFVIDYNIPLKNKVKKRPKGSPAELLETIMDNEELFEKVMGEGGITVREAFAKRPFARRTVDREFEILKDLGIFVPAEGGRFHYSFAPEIRDMDAERVRSLIDEINGIEQDVGVKGGSRPLHLGDIPIGRRPEVAVLVNNIIRGRAERPEIRYEQMLLSFMEDEVVQERQRSPDEDTREMPLKGVESRHGSAIMNVVNSVLSFIRQYTPFPRIADLVMSILRRVRQRLSDNAIVNLLVIALTRCLHDVLYALNRFADREGFSDLVERLPLRLPKKQAGQFTQTLSEVYHAGELEDGMGVEVVAFTGHISGGRDLVIRHKERDNPWQAQEIEVEVKTGDHVSPNSDAVLAWINQQMESEYRRRRADIHAAGHFRPVTEHYDTPAIYTYNRQPWMDDEAVEKIEEGIQETLRAELGASVAARIAVRPVDLSGKKRVDPAVIVDEANKIGDAHRIVQGLVREEANDLEREARELQDRLRADPGFGLTVPIPVLRGMLDELGFNEEGARTAERMLMAANGRNRHRMVMLMRSAHLATNRKTRDDKRAMPVSDVIDEIRKLSSGKGSPADCLSSIRYGKTADGIPLLEKARSYSGFNAREDLWPLRRNKNDKMFSWTTFYYREIHVLQELGILVPLKGGEPERYRFSELIIGKNENHTSAVLDTLDELEHRIGEKGEKRVLHRGAIKKDQIPEIRELVSMAILSHQKTAPASVSAATIKGINRDDIRGSILGIFQKSNKSIKELKKDLLSGLDKDDIKWKLPGVLCAMLDAGVLNTENIGPVLDELLKVPDIDDLDDYNFTCYNLYKLFSSPATDKTELFENLSVLIRLIDEKSLPSDPCSIYNSLLEAGAITNLEELRKAHDLIILIGYNVDRFEEQYEEGSWYGSFAEESFATMVKKAGAKGLGCLVQPSVLLPKLRKEGLKIKGLQYENKFAEPNLVEWIERYEHFLNSARKLGSAEEIERVRSITGRGFTDCAGCLVDLKLKIKDVKGLIEAAASQPEALIRLFELMDEISLRQDRIDYSDVMYDLSKKARIRLLDIMREIFLERPEKALAEAKRIMTVVKTYQDNEVKLSAWEEARWAAFWKNYKTAFPANQENGATRPEKAPEREWYEKERQIWPETGFHVQVLETGDLRSKQVALNALLEGFLRMRIKPGKSFIDRLYEMYQAAEEPLKTRILFLLIVFGLDSDDIRAMILEIWKPEAPSDLLHTITSGIGYSVHSGTISAIEEKTLVKKLMNLSSHKDPEVSFSAFMCLDYLNKRGEITISDTLLDPKKHRWSFYKNKSIKAHLLSEKEISALLKHASSCPSPAEFIEDLFVEKGNRAVFMGEAGGEKPVFSPTKFRSLIEGAGITHIAVPFSIAEREQFEKFLRAEMDLEEKTRKITVASLPDQLMGSYLSKICCKELESYTEVFTGLKDSGQVSFIYYDPAPGTRKSPLGELGIDIRNSVIRKALESSTDSRVLVLGAWHDMRKEQRRAEVTLASEALRQHGKENVSTVLVLPEERMDQFCEKANNLPDLLEKVPSDFGTGIEGLPLSDLKLPAYAGTFGGSYDGLIFRKIPDEGGEDDADEPSWKRPDATPAPGKIPALSGKGSPADLLQAIRDNPEILEKALSEEGITVDEIAEIRPFARGTVYKELKILKDACVFSAAGKRAHYRFSGSLRGPDINYTKTMINAVCDIKFDISKRGDRRPLHRGSIPQDRKGTLKELVRMTVLHQAKLMQGPTTQKNKVLWHIIDPKLLSRGQDNSWFFQKINKASRESDTPERIYFLGVNEDIGTAIRKIEDRTPDAVIDVALSARELLHSVPDSFGDEKIKTLVFEGKVGDLTQIEGITAALRALHLEREEVIPELLRIYAILHGSPFDGEIPSQELLEDPKAFARAFVFMLPPVERIPISDMVKLNERLLNFIISA